MKKQMWTLGLLVLAVGGFWAQESSALQDVGGVATHGTGVRPDKDGVYPAGLDVDAPKLIDASPAIYPADPSLASLKRGCLLDLVVKADGTPANIQVSGTHCSPFETAAIEAVRQSQFAPGKFHGNPVATRTRAWVLFQSKEKPAVPEIFSAKNTAPPVLLNAVEAEYSEEARRADYQGVAMVAALIGEDGRPTNIQVVRALGKGLDEKASQAVAKYRFRPAMKDGIPVSTFITVEVNFRLYHRF
jgi:TonB family protein